jgi:membrane-bound acyltransferase YfiQ involved in biofilm formation
VKRVGLSAVMTLSAINIWTGAPLLALWVGSRIPGETSRISMTAVLVVVVVMLGLCLALIVLLNRTSLAYDELTGRSQAVKRHVPWLRSMRAERVEYERDRQGLTLLERLLVVMVVVAFLAFEAWFFIASPSPIEPGRRRTDMQ